jgi:hypothetical protein
MLALGATFDEVADVLGNSAKVVEKPYQVEPQAPATHLEPHGSFAFWHVCGTPRKRACNSLKLQAQNGAERGT